jgi:hypothetical protein
VGAGLSLADFQELGSRRQRNRQLFIEGPQALQHSSKRAACLQRVDPNGLASSNHLIFQTSLPQGFQALRMEAPSACCAAALQSFSLK